MLLTPFTLVGIRDYTLINLNEWLKGQLARQDERIDLTPGFTQYLLNDFHDRTQEVSYGGYLEDRSWMWQGTYIEKTGQTTHLGVDINVRAGTVVSLPFPAHVLHSFVDPDTDVGWGGRVIVQTHPDFPAIILAHLTDELPAQGSLIPAAQQIGRVGTWPANGNVFEHLHVQLIHQDKVNQLRADHWRDLDGYGTLAQAADYPDPLSTPVA